MTDPAKANRIALITSSSEVGACALSDTIAASVLTGFGTARFGPVFATWFASHTLGMVIFATLTVITRAQGRRLLGRPGHRVELASSMLHIATAAFAVFNQSRYPALFLVYPPLLFSAYRHRFSGVVFGVAIVTVIAVAKTMAGNGPFQLIPSATPASASSSCRFSSPAPACWRCRSRLY